MPSIMRSPVHRTDQITLGVFRFLYLNTYSILLLLLAAAVFFIPLYRVHIFFLLIQICTGIVCLARSVKLFAAWNDKKRKYAVLMAKNRNTIQEETFAVFMQAPCGRLLVKTVLRDLGALHRYASLKKFKTDLRTTIKNNCTPMKTVIYINKDYL